MNLPKPIILSDVKIIHSKVPEMEQLYLDFNPGPKKAWISCEGCESAYTEALNIVHKCEICRRFLCKTCCPEEICPACKKR